MQQGDTFGALVDKASDMGFWRALCPGMSISDSPFLSSPPPYVVDMLEAGAARAGVVEEGYFRVGPVVPQADIALLARATSAVVEAGFPASFVLVYDQAWRMLARLDNLLSPILGATSCFTRDTWVYYIRAVDEAPSAVKESTGWRPHRDTTRPAVGTLRDDGRPHILNVWIPFTDTTPDHSCIYVLPTNRDPTYPGNLDEPLLPKSALQDVRALPARAGAVLGWNEYVLHWGSRSGRPAAGPRISLATRFQTREVDPVLFPHLTVDSPFDFQDRLGVIGTNVRRYGNFVQYPAPLRDFCDRQRLLYIGAEYSRAVQARRGAAG